MRNPTTGMLRSIFAFTVLLAVTTAHAGQTITVQAANSGNNQILSVMFAPPGGSTSVLNTDEASLYSLTSLVFVQNLNTFAIDLFATDNQKGKVLDYIGDFSTGAFFCNPPTNTISPPCRTGTVVTRPRVSFTRPGFRRITPVTCSSSTTRPASHRRRRCGCCSRKRVGVFKTRR